MVFLITASNRVEDFSTLTCSDYRCCFQSLTFFHIYRITIRNSEMSCEFQLPTLESWRDFYTLTVCWKPPRCWWLWSGLVYANHLYQGKTVNLPLAMVLLRLRIIEMTMACQPRMNKPIGYIIYIYVWGISLVDIILAWKWSGYHFSTPSLFGDISK